MNNQPNSREQATGAEPLRQASISPQRSEPWRKVANLIWESYQAELKRSIPFPQEHREAFEQAAKWVLRVAMQAEGRRPWLHIQGDNGTGKTTLGRAVAAVLSRLTDSTNWSMPAVRAAKHASEGDKYGYYENTKVERCVVFIDDIGGEPSEVQYFGNVRQPIAEIFYYRYDEDLPTIYTTNLSGAALGQKYGERVLDRMREKAVVITLTGESWRKKANKA